ncbi:MAG: cation:dicarboxylate symporter family transporter, partial [Saezia sp.]
MNSTTVASEALFQGAFFENFLQLTHYQTLLALVALGMGFYLVRLTHKKFANHTSSFSIRMLTAMVIGAVLGLGLQALEGFPVEKTVILTEASKWYGLFGRSFIALIRMLVIPIVFVSIVKVVIDFANEKSLSKIAFRGVFWLLFTTGIATIVGIVLANLIGFGSLEEFAQGGAKIREQTNLVDTLVNLIPNNIVSAMNANNVVGLVLFSAMIGLASVVVERTYPEPIAVFKSFIDALHKIVMQMTRFVISLMPYAVVALLAGTIMSNGIPAIVKVSGFVLAIYIATLIMLLVHIFLIAVHGLSPITFLKKSMDALLMAFTSRSSMGTLPLTISTLTDRMGVHRSTANLIPSLGATMGMNGCAGFFPALIVMMVAQMVGVEINLQF